MRWIKGKTVCKKFPKTASETFTAGRMVDVASGYVTNVTSASVVAVGIIKESVASTDADFASTTDVMVELPKEPTCVFEANATTTLAVTDVGNVLDFSDSNTVNENANTYGPVTCVGYISTTKGLFVLNGFKGYRMAKS